MRRRYFLDLAARITGTAAVAPSLGGLIACSEPATSGPSGKRPSPAQLGEGGYGPLRSAGRELALPNGFEFRVFGREGEVMSDGRTTPRAHDGMAAFRQSLGHIRLVRNHEDRSTPSQARPLGDAGTAYDARAGGGTTTLEVGLDSNGVPVLVRDFVSLGGTIVNCAGGPTPWGTWLTCEETTEGTDHGWDRAHGFVFEVPAGSDSQVSARPVLPLGRFVHEAVAVDPSTGIVYETEDRSNAGFYRFIPDVPRELAEGGRLEMLAVAKKPNLDTSNGIQSGSRFPVTWVEIDDPVPEMAEHDPASVFRQGREKGGTKFSRLEGCWFGDDSIFFHATDGGEAGTGQVWQYRPRAEGEGEIVLVFESPGPQVLDGPDNITVSPTGGILICEDGGGTNYLRGLTPEGRIFDFARNDLNNREFAGATFAFLGRKNWSGNNRLRSGGTGVRRVLFVNLQGDTSPDGPGNPSMTFAIWGPWEKGAL